MGQYRDQVLNELHKETVGTSNNFDSVVHLGSYLTVNLLDDLDIRMKIMDFIRQANAVL